jgi:hypothetical protein
MFPSIPDTNDIHHLHAEAGHIARRLRREAVGDFWKSADALCQQGLAASHAWGRRNATRFFHLTKKA